MRLHFVADACKGNFVWSLVCIFSWANTIWVVYKLNDELNLDKWIHYSKASQLLFLSIEDFSKKKKGRKAEII